MDVDEVLLGVIKISEKSKRLKTPAKVSLRLSKSEVHYAYTTGNILVNDNLVRYFDLFSKFNSVLINILFDGLGGNKVSVVLLKHKYL